VEVKIKGGQAETLQYIEAESRVGQAKKGDLSWQSNRGFNVLER
jgi:hypothetical protein